MLKSNSLVTGMRADDDTSLQYKALLKISSSLWNEDSILQEIFDDSPWHLVEDRVRKSVQKLALPQSLKKRVDGIIVPMGHQIASWVAPPNEGIKPPKTEHVFHWNSRGSIDKRRTAKGVIQNEKVDPVDRFVLACFYCLGSEIRSLWNRIDKNDAFKLGEKLLSHDIVAFWTLQMDSDLNWLPYNFLKSRFHRRPSSVLLLIEEAIKCRNLPAVEFFFSKLTAQQKDTLFGNFFSQMSENIHKYPYNFNTELFYFLFSSMDADHQRARLRECPYKILLLFLDWPWQDLFLYFAERCCRFLSQKEFARVLGFLSLKKRKNFADYNDLFEQLWMESPRSLRRFVIEDDFKGVFMCLDSLDENNIKLFLKDNSAEERNKIIFSRNGMSSCIIFCCSKRWLLFKSFVTECLLTPQSVVNFKEDFAEFFVSVGEQDMVDSDESVNRQLLKEAGLILDSLLKKRCSETIYSNK